MTVKNALTDEQVTEIVHLHKRKVAMTEIAERYGRTIETIRGIVTGRSYRHVTGRDHKPDTNCHCLICTVFARADANQAIAYAALCAFECVTCGRKVWRNAPNVRRMQGNVLCDICDGRKQK